MISRRKFLGFSGTAAFTSLMGGGSGLVSANNDEYRALVVLYLNGGNDGNNLLIPTDGAYSDYQTARANLAIPKSSLTPLEGSAIGHSFALHPSLAPLAPLYLNRRLALISNVGPLIEPATAAQVLAQSVKIPQFLGSHSDQTAIVQGWNLTEDLSGWAGRGLERLDARLRNPMAAVTMDTNRTLVLGRNSTVTFMPPGGNRYWGPADVAQPQTAAAQTINSMARFQFANQYEAEFSRTFGSELMDATRLTRAFLEAKQPTADFGTDHLGNQMRALASVLPYFKAQGLKRQVFLIHWGGFDTHTNQRGGDMNSQDSQFITLAKVLAAFDATNVSNGLDSNITTLMMSEFGRTLRPGSGGGSEHAWGSHWAVLGGPVAGGNVYGSFPQLVLGGVDDSDGGRNGRFVPGVSSDQVGATLLQWLGVAPTDLTSVFPHLANFPSRTLPLLWA